MMKLKMVARHHGKELFQQTRLYIRLIAGYRDTKDVISLYEKGTGDFNEMRTKILEKEEVLFAFIRVEGKFALITYISDKANGVRRARALVHGRAVAAVFKVIAF
jgi:hypothetical protein